MTSWDQHMGRNQMKNHKISWNIKVMIRQNRFESVIYSRDSSESILLSCGSEKNLNVEYLEDFLKTYIYYL